MTERRSQKAGLKGDPTGVDVEFPAKLLPLMEHTEPGADPSLRKRYYVAYGGRDSAKSWSFARALLLQSMADPLRILCAREIMRTIADSVHYLLSRQIEQLNAGAYFTVHDAYIENTTGANFAFAGLRQQDATKIKSFEGCDIVWVEEAHSVTKRSWEILIPTIRAERSEIWASFNPELDTDDTYQRFVVKKPENAWVQKVTWRDNPWYSKVLDQERLRLKHDDPIEYDNVWEGNPRAVVAGAIYANEVTRMIEEGRYGRVPYDPKLPVHTIWDLGWNDQTTIIFAQLLSSEIRLIDYEEESFLTYPQWAKRLSDKEYIYGQHWLPHDGGNKTQAGKGKSAKDILAPLLKTLPKVAKRPDTVEVPIKMARMMWPRVYMDNTKCPRLMDCLKRFRRGVPESTGEPGTPIKDEYRHGADAFGVLAMNVDKISNDVTPRKVVLETYEPSDSGMGI